MTMWKEQQGKKNSTRGVAMKEELQCKKQCKVVTRSITKATT